MGIGATSPGGAADNSPALPALGKVEENGTESRRDDTSLDRLHLQGVIHAHAQSTPIPANFSANVLRKYLGDLAVTKAATHLRVTRVTLSRVLNGKAGISAAMAIRLAAALGTSPELWMNMQSQYDLWRARQGRQPAVRRFAHAAG
jgi:addiction module HigA family antidote